MCPLIEMVGVEFGPTISVCDTVPVHHELRQ